MLLLWACVVVLSLTILLYGISGQWADLARYPVMHDTQGCQDLQGTHWWSCMISETLSDLGAAILILGIPVVLTMFYLEHKLRQLISVTRKRSVVQKRADVIVGFMPLVLGSVLVVFGAWVLMGMLKESWIVNASTPPNTAPLSLAGCRGLNGPAWWGCMITGTISQSMGVIVCLVPPFIIACLVLSDLFRKIAHKEVAEHTES